MRGRAPAHRKPPAVLTPHQARAAGRPTAGTRRTPTPVRTALLRSGEFRRLEPDRLARRPPVLRRCPREAAAPNHRPARRRRRPAHRPGRRHRRARAADRAARPRREPAADARSVPGRQAGTRSVPDRQAGARNGRPAPARRPEPARRTAPAGRRAAGHPHARGRRVLLVQLLALRAAGGPAHPVGRPAPGRGDAAPRPRRVARQPRRGRTARPRPAVLHARPAR